MTGFVFPGQGSQAVGMGKSLYESSTDARAMLERLDSVMDGALLPLCLEGPDEALRDTRNAQPAIYAVSCAAWAAARAAGVDAEMTAGHSIGEYAALVAAGVLEPEEGLRLVRVRAEAMAEAAARAPGAMAAVLGLDAETVDTVCSGVDGIVGAANLNCPGQVVISGATDAVAAAGDALKAAGAKRVVPLAVSGAFHSPLMRDAAVRLSECLAGAELAAARIPVVANVTADFEREPAEIVSNLVAQVPGRVRWTESVERMRLAGCDRFIECGHGTVIAGLVRKIVPGVDVVSVGDAESLARLLEGAGAS
ncbi:MAG: ACP S-malonyltransferase [Armatimonadota bacterium]